MTTCSVKNPSHIEVLDQQIEAACAKVAPLYPLSHFVAVNPFVGFSTYSFSRTAKVFKRIQDADLVLPKAYFAQRFREGRITNDDLEKAISFIDPDVREAFHREEVALSAETLVDFLGDGAELTEVASFKTCSFSAFLDARDGEHWQSLIREEVAKWCAAFDDEGQSSWKFPWKHLSLYAAWKEAAKIDPSPEMNGLKGFRAFVNQLSDDPHEFVLSAIDRLQMPEEKVDSLLYRIFMTLPGWSAHLRYKDRELELRDLKGDSLLQLLAIVLSYEVALFETKNHDQVILEDWTSNLQKDPVFDDLSVIPFELAQRLVWQGAVECAYERKLSAQLQSAAELGSRTVDSRPDVQAVFCIDVRSEIFRRALETTHSSIQTIGFAGFFGLPIDHDIPGLGGTQARCPALMAPPVSTQACRAGIEDFEFDQLVFQRIDARESKRAWKRFKEAAASCFTFVETIGLSYGVELLKDALSLNPSARTIRGAPAFDSRITLEEKIDWAGRILKGLSLTNVFAKRILFCGHGSTTKNNPYASSLECGACGGHAGDANARLAAALLNDPLVRDGLRDKGFVIPDDTKFLAGLHDTTLDQVILFDVEADDLLTADLQQSLNKAAEICSVERALHLDSSGDKPRTLSDIRKRGHDWSQVRPEWALAGNAAFILGPRSWTQGKSFEGRSFLHDYEADADEDGQTLESILAGPLVVGSWINLQYLASATDNAHLGSGHKSIHNVVGGIGVALGNESDLRSGLPLQSVHTGTELRHEPLRLHVCIAADADAIDSALSRQAHVRDLVENEWILLFACGNNGQFWKRRLRDGSWT